MKRGIGSCLQETQDLHTLLPQSNCWRHSYSLGVCDKHLVVLLCYLISCLCSVTCVWNRFSHHQNTQKWEIRDREWLLFPNWSTWSSFISVFKGFKVVLGEAIISQRNYRQICEQLHEFFSSVLAKIRVSWALHTTGTLGGCFLETLDICKALWVSF